MPDSVYGPARNLCEGLLKGWGIETTYYDPRVDEAGMAALIRPNTRVVYTESPGSHTFEVQDIPAIARAAHARGCIVMMDNTWGIHHFMPFTHGVDVSIQALTKYVGGHSDVLLGSVTVNNEADWKVLRAAGSHSASMPGRMIAGWRCAASAPWRCGWRQVASGIEVARWLGPRPEVIRVMHPALPGPQHALWKRDFTGACSLFGVVFQPHIRGEDAPFIDAWHCSASARAGAASRAWRCHHGFHDPHGRKRRVRGPAGAAPYRAGGSGGPDRRPRAGLKVMREFGR